MKTSVLNELIKNITVATKQGKQEHFIIKCDNCTLSILTCSHFDSAEFKTVEIAVRDKNDSDYFKMPSGFHGGCDDYDKDYYDFNASIMHYMSILGIPLVIKAFYHASEDDIPEIFDSFNFISNFCI